MTRVPSKLVLVRIVREAGIEGEGATASESVADWEKLRSRLAMGLVLIMCRHNFSPVVNTLPVQCSIPVEREGINRLTS